MGWILRGCLCALLCSAAAYAAPFTGRYEIESIERDGVSISGWIDFLAAPMGTTEFNLSDSFVTGFEIRASGTPILADLVYDDLADKDRDDKILFQSALGASELVAAANAGATKVWTGIGDLDGQSDGDDQVTIGVLNAIVPYTRWVANDDGTALYSVNSGLGGSPPAWKLVLVPDQKPVPEPGTWLLLGSALAGFAWFRRRR